MLARSGYSMYDDRCFKHPGVVLDLGCLSWDWSRDFVGKKRVIGFDISETKQLPGAELRRQLVLPFGGQRELYGASGSMGCSALSARGTPDHKSHTAVALHDVLAEFPVMPSILKMNIEGSEFPLLFSLRAPPSDQLIVSFHDFKACFPYPKKLSEVVRDYLSVWYDWRLTYAPFSWWLGLLKAPLREGQ